MNKRPKIIVRPDAEPISIEEARAHCEAPALGDSDTDVDAVDDALFSTWIETARAHCEEFLGLSLSRRVLELALDRFPSKACDGTNAIELPFGPVVEVLSVRVEGVTGAGGTDTDQAVDVGDYIVDDFAEVVRLVPVSGWPTITPATNAVRITYGAGFGEDSDGGEPLPGWARAAMLLIVGHLYANREENTVDALQSLPLGVEAILRPHRVRLGFA